MSARPPTIVTPPSTLGVLVAGIATARRRANGRTMLPRATLALPERPIEARPVRDYADLTGFAPDHGVPPVFPHVLAFPLHLALMMRRDFPFPMAGTVHVANRIAQHAALAIGDRLAIRAVAAELLAHPRGQAFAIDVVATRGDDTVWESRSLYLHRTRTVANGAAVPDMPAAPGEDARVAWEGVVPRAIGRRYARVSGDRNPIHTSAFAARLFGFRRPIAHGMWTLARAVAGTMPDRPVGHAVIDAGFRAPLPLPSRVRLSADAAGGFAMASADGGHFHLAGTIAC